MKRRLHVVIRTALIGILLACAAAASSAQTPAAPPVRDFSPPPDVAAPPADAAKTESGLASKMLSAGTLAEQPQRTDIVTVHYTAWSADGKMFDSSIARNRPATFPLNRVMAGWSQCVQLMAVGEKRRCWIPQALAYNGQTGRPAGTVVFDIELLDTRPTPMIAPADLTRPPAEAKKTATGISYKVLREGTGSRKPSAFSQVTVHYSGWTQDGKMFDSSLIRGAPTTFRLDDVIRGWTEGVQLMVEGERARFWIPENLAYKGQQGSPRGMLVFDIELVQINN